MSVSICVWSQLRSVYSRCSLNARRLDFVANNVETGQATMGLPMGTLSEAHSGQCLLSKWIILGYLVSAEIIC